jgi:histidinol-phosphate aminotransferase
MTTSPPIVEVTPGGAPRRTADLYAPPRRLGPIDLCLDANEGPCACVDLAQLAASVGPEKLRRYPSAADLERLIAQRLGVRPAQVVVTAGGDDAIDRCCRAFLGPGLELIAPRPTFEMIPRFVRMAGAQTVSPSWPSGPFPVRAVLEELNPRTAMIAVVTPNNPTGAVATAHDLEQLSAGAPRAVLLVDLAYTEFADEGLTSAALALPNAIVVRTFSKAYGLAGLRVGYAVGSEDAIVALRASGTPFPAGALSLCAAEQALREGEPAMQRAVKAVRAERTRLRNLLLDLGARPIESQANFVLAEFDDAQWVWSALAGVGIAVRRFDTGSGLTNSLRITCPGNEASFERLCRALRTAVRPEALLFDMDGVLVDVSRSYRRAIAMTAESFGVRVSAAQIAGAKAESDANNDWIVTQRLVSRAGVDAPLDEVTARFERLYQGTRTAPGLEREESLIPPRALLESLASRVRLGVVTGRPRRDAERFLRRFELDRLFGAVVCMEDSPRKPDPAPVRLAMQTLGVTSAWMIGDTPDDITAARAAGVVPLGIAAPGDNAAAVRLEEVGAARVLSALAELEVMLP